jgi:GGDEF domain-containing protein
VPDHANDADPAAPSTPPGPRRKRKFVLPEHHHDEQVDRRTDGHIEAFLDGSAHPARRRTDGPIRIHRPLALDTRQDWTAAVAHESARHARYGRPATVVILEVTGPQDSRAIDRTARALADVIRAEGRETDRAVRFGALGFRLLLPETGGRAARTLVARIERAFLATLDGRSPGVNLCTEVAIPIQTGTLEEALADAEARLARRTREG